MEFWSRMYKIFTDLDAEWDLVLPNPIFVVKCTNRT